jgi:stage V sporulation protein R
MGLPPQLVEERDRIRGVAKSLGLDFFETVFVLLNYERMCEVASFEGFPQRYPHWRFGMEFERNYKLHGYGLAKIYELVINNDPCFAYLLEGNSMMEQKLVIAHVYGHSDFFKNNAYFQRTDRKMVDGMANHGVQIRRYMDLNGVDVVENFIDLCLSIDNLIDPFAPPEVRKGEEEDELRRADVETSEDESPRLMVSKSYMEDWINPPEYLERQRLKKEKQEREDERFPAVPERDIMGFLMENAPLKRWQRHILGMLRQEALYFVPQRQTKIMNEGWASFWHSKMMTEHLACPNEIVDFAETHSATMAMSPGQINPYKIGVELFRNIEERWDKGQFGPEWNNCDDLRIRSNWNRQLNDGRRKIFEVRKIHNDVTFIDEFLTPEMIDQLKMYDYRFDPKRGQWIIESRDPEKIRNRLLFQLTNYGQPVIWIQDANYRNRGELLLQHHTDSIGLEKSYARRTLSNVARMWHRPVHVRTLDHRGKSVMWSFGPEGQEIEA